MTKALASPAEHTETVLVPWGSAALMYLERCGFSDALRLIRRIKARVVYRFFRSLVFINN